MLQSFPPITKNQVDIRISMKKKKGDTPRSRKIQNPSGRTPGHIYRTETPRIEKSKTPVEEAPVSSSEKKIDIEAAAAAAAEVEQPKTTEEKKNKAQLGMPKCDR
ncbi:unnamed protein product, partial [Vitis vinifera]|uniref:Uncharacterized protein n=1 Tax=Vitis vinifera TaxID=29760 RepID=D7U434_VITVI